MEKQIFTKTESNEYANKTSERSRQRLGLIEVNGIKLPFRNNFPDNLNQFIDGFKFFLLQQLAAEQKLCLFVEIVSIHLHISTYDFYCFMVLTTIYTTTLPSQTPDTSIKLSKKRWLRK